jgi:RND family efflux transporter MFP subunit
MKNPNIMKTLTLIGIIVLSGLAYTCTTSPGKENAFSDTVRIPVGILKLKLQEVPLKMHTSGQFTTNDETYLSFKTGGIIDKIFVKEGDAIRKGQLLATMNLTEINTLVAQAQLALEKAKRDYDRTTSLHMDSVATLEQFQNSKTAFGLATKQFEVAQFNRSYSEIRAVDDGHVLRKMASEGQVITSGSPVLQTNGGKEGNWVLKAGISDREWAVIKLGDNALVFIDALPGETFAAEVVRKSGGTDPYTGSFTAELRLTGKLPSAIASGLFGKAVITPSSTRKAWSIPYDALLDGDSQSGFVFVTNDMKTAQKQKIVIAGIEKDRVIVSAGLENINALIIAGSAYLRDNSPIRVLDHTIDKTN